MRIVVTGGSGFVGRHVVGRLVEEDADVAVVTRSAENLVGFPWEGRVEIIERDLSAEPTGCFEDWGRPDKVVHLAWDGLPNYREDFHVVRNLPADLSFLGSLLDSGLRDLTVAGTCFEYGLREGLVSEADEAGPVIPYAIAKDTVRRFLEHKAGRCGVSVKWLRLFYMHGEGQSPRSILGLLKTAAANGDEAFPMSLGEQLRDYSRVEDIASYIVSCSLQTKVEGIINCCSGEPISIRRFVEEQARDMGITIELQLGRYPYLDYEPLAFWGRRERLEEVLFEAGGTANGR